jgi:hypothetical protein
MDQASHERRPVVEKGLFRQTLPAAPAIARGAKDPRKWAASHRVPGGEEAAFFAAKCAETPRLQRPTRLRRFGLSP